VPRKRTPSAEELSQELAEAIATKDSRRAMQLTRQLEARLGADLDADQKREAGGDSRQEPADAQRAFAASPAVVPVRRAARSTGSARQTVTAALAEIGVPVRARVVSDYAEARFGDRVDTRAFSALRRDERRAWGSSSPRPTYIVPALEGRYFQPIRGLLALSDWPIERRLIGPWSERADHLAATAQLARQLAWLSERDREVAERLAPVVAAMARSIPGALDGREVDTARVEAAAEAELEEVAARDEPWRKEAGERARRQLSETDQLWGAEVRVVEAGDG
jgi:hypothetical protein